MLHLSDFVQKTKVKKLMKYFDICAEGLLTFGAQPAWSPAHTTLTPVARIWCHCDPETRPLTRYLSLSGRLTLHTKTCCLFKKKLFNVVLVGILCIYLISCWQWVIVFVSSHVAVLLAWRVCLRRIKLHSVLFSVDNIFSKLTVNVNPPLYT